MFWGLITRAQSYTVPMGGCCVWVCEHMRHGPSRKRKERGRSCASAVNTANYCREVGGGVRLGVKRDRDTHCNAPVG